MKKKFKPLAPCDCIDQHDVKCLSEQGICVNDESIVVEPNHVILTMGHTTIRIGMNRFKLFAEWYLQKQETVSEPHSLKSDDTTT